MAAAPSQHGTVMNSFSDTRRRRSLRRRAKVVSEPTVHGVVASGPPGPHWTSGALGQFDVKIFFLDVDDGFQSPRRRAPTVRCSCARLDADSLCADASALQSQLVAPRRRAPTVRVPACSFACLPPSASPRRDIAARAQRIGERAARDRRREHEPRRPLPAARRGPWRRARLLREARRPLGSDDVGRVGRRSHAVAAALVGFGLRAGEPVAILADVAAVDCSRWARSPAA